MWAALALVVVAALAGGVRYYIWSLHHESTDDAFIDCHVVNVASRVAGRVLRVSVTAASNLVPSIETGQLWVSVLTCASGPSPMQRLGNPAPDLRMA